MPISGWLADVIGRKRYYMICVALFTGARCMCGLATASAGSWSSRACSRAIGGGGLAPTEQAIFADTSRRESAAQAFAVYGVTWSCAPAIGPALGGWITDNFSWHWVFLINLPVGLLSLTLVTGL